MTIAMKRCFALLAALWAPVLAVGSSGAQDQTDPVVIGQTVRLPSGTLKETSTLLISTPDGYEQGDERYPVLFLLDGETHFQYASGIVRFLAGNGKIPKLILVGIASGDYARRTRDLTPPSSNEIDNRFSPGNGGADAFLSFVAGELIPFVDRTYRTRPYRLLAGHSFGGLFAIHTLITRPGLFNGFIVADPSLYWNSEAVAVKAESFLSATASLQSDFYMTASDDSGKVPGAVARLHSALMKKSPAGFRWTFTWMKQENHASIPLPSLYRGLETVFQDWDPADPLDLFGQGGIQAIHQRFSEAGVRFGYPERKTPPFTISLLVSGLMKAGRLQEASIALLHDPKSYPPPWNQLDALARAFEKKGNAAQAAKHYRLSLVANPDNEFARRRLLALGASVQEPPKD